ncbi:MAG: hypothetical protein R3217_09870 [Gammaproteobacteria bacterium]|nr:hypothetical protein [Gammaproteobacteria bacterium]
MKNDNCRALLARIECELARLARNPENAPVSWRQLEYLLEELRDSVERVHQLRLERLLVELTALQASDFRQAGFKDQVLLARASCVTWQRDLAMNPQGRSTTAPAALD